MILISFCSLFPNGKIELVVLLYCYSINFFSSPIVHYYFRQVIDPDTTKSSNIGHSLTGVMTRGKYMHMLSSKDLAPTDYRFKLK